MNKPVCLLRLDNYYFTLIAFIYNDVTKANDLVFIKSLPNNNQNNYESSNFLQTDLKMQLNLLISCLKKELHINFIDEIIISYGFSSFQTTNTTFYNYNDFMKLESNFCNNDHTELLSSDQKSYVAVDFGISHYSKENSYKLISYYILKYDYQLIIDLCQSLNLKIKQFIVSQAHLNGFEFNDHDSKASLLLEIEDYKTIFKTYNQTNLISNVISEAKNHFCLANVITQTAQSLNINSKKIESYFRDINYNNQKIIEINVDPKLLFTYNSICGQDLENVFLKIFQEHFEKSLLLQFDHPLLDFNPKNLAFLFINTPFNNLNQIFHRFFSSYFKEIKVEVFQNKSFVSSNCYEYSTSQALAKQDFYNMHNVKNFDNFSNENILAKMYHQTVNVKNF
ncbi:conserved hypothetical protein [Ureaplasma urealyticum serovar 13 str. ATCC 33698]|uniref:hypothetical protein n=1 Tax=Ureaplasma urealyticum TaxID=2130 RepID=UPI00016C0B9A|nr:hypothetical protein [Ureaplasma urealyticum]EDT49336.1 conserved hypothetical protein [Ureaplasma urealyticum serovar 13 str. ATCC 33698]